MEGVSDWKYRVTNVICNLPVTPSEFWQMDTEDLDFWYQIAESKKEAIRKSIEDAKKGKK